MPNVSNIEFPNNREAYLSDHTDDPDDLLFDRCSGHFSGEKYIFEVYRDILLFTGSGLSRFHLSKKAWRYVKY